MPGRIDGVTVEDDRRDTLPVLDRDLAALAPRPEAIIALSGDDTMEAPAMVAGADRFLLKPVRRIAEFQAAILIKGQARATSPGRIGTVLAEKFQAMGGEILTRTVRGILPSETGG